MADHPKFYLELPDPDGNTALPLGVYEGRIVQGGSPEARSFSNPARQVLLFDGVPETATGWNGMYTDAYSGYTEVAGPVRTLTRNEYDALLKSLGSA